MSSATISGPGDIYRYSLTRTVVPQPKTKSRMLWVMVNPSTADATNDDHTIRKCMGFAQRWGIETFDVVNLFAFRSKDIKRLKIEMDSLDIVGPDNDAQIRYHARKADFVVCAWGSKHKLPKKYAESRPQEVLRILNDNTAGSPIYCLGRTKAGCPVHPLITPYSAQREKFP